MSDRPNIILCNLRAFYLLFWDKKRVLTQDQQEISDFNNGLMVDAGLEKFLQYFEKYFRKMLFKHRLWWSVNHPIRACRVFRQNPYFLFDMKSNPSFYLPYHGSH